jgi:DNA repair protein RadC
MSMQPRAEVHQIREVAVRYVGRSLRSADVLRTPADAAALARRIVRDDAREHFLAIYLDGRHRPVAYQVVSIGTATASLVHPREVFQPAVLVGACALILGHNHPSGDPAPSAEDRSITRRLAEAGNLLGIPVLDHLVWTRSGAFTSLRELDSSLFSA